MDSTAAPLVVRLITWLPVGGIERRLVSVLPRLVERGFRARVVCLREEGALAGELRDAGIPVDVLRLRSRLDPVRIRMLAGMLRKWGASVVHSHMYRSNVPGTLAARWARTPVVFSQVHNIDTWETPRQAWLDRQLCRWRTGVVCVSRAVQQDVCARLRLTEERAPILYNGCDTEVFRPDTRVRAETRRALGVAEDEVTLLVPARLHSQKRPLEVLRAFAAATDGGDGRARLLYAGAGPMEERLREAIREAGMGERVSLLGRRDDMAELYNAADAVVLSSEREGFSNAVIESLASGKPVIAADVGGNKEAIDSPEVGWIHARGDDEALARQMREALGNATGLRAREEACRARGLAFGLNALVEATTALYRKGLGIKS
jgi:glycosyltransferase involved in cell wall biosynthesis